MGRTVADLGENATGVVADNADPATPARLIGAAREAFGRLDGALISVGGPRPGMMERTEDEWRQASSRCSSVRSDSPTAIGAELEDGGSIAFVLSTSAKMPVTDSPSPTAFGPAWPW